MKTRILCAPGTAALTALVLFASSASGANLRVMKTGLGSGAVTSSDSSIGCGTNCDQSYGTAVTVSLAAAADAGSIFVRWVGDCSGAACTMSPLSVTMNADRSVRAEFGLTTPIPPLTTITPAGIAAYLGATDAAHTQVNTPARFIAALPAEYKQNWILMSRSESLQTGIATSPRLLLPSADARNVFTVGMSPNSSYPGASPLAVEYMQWDGMEKNFRFHEIILDHIDPMGSIDARNRGVSVDDSKCFKCHSTRNVLNRGTTPGTTGIPIGSVKFKNKPNWDTYDSWGGMLPFNRDRIYQGSLEAAAFRAIFNPWTWRTNDAVRSIIEQLQLQPSGIPPAHEICRVTGGTNDGHVNLGFDYLAPTTCANATPVLTEPAPTGTLPAGHTSYEFNRVRGTTSGSDITRNAAYITLHHSAIPSSDEGRGVHFFDLLGTKNPDTPMFPEVSHSLNGIRIADELLDHRHSVNFIDVRPIALAIAAGCVVTNSGGTITTPGSSTPLMTDLSFFNSRHGITSLGELITDTANSAKTIPRRKADIQKMNFDRSVDAYTFASVPDLIRQYGAATSAGATDTGFPRLRQDVFRRPIDLGPGMPQADSESIMGTSVMEGVYVDREDYVNNTNRVALFRYFLEPLGVSVDKWSMGVRGRSRTYTFADVLGSYTNEIQAVLKADLGLGMGLVDCTALMGQVNSSLSSLPSANAVPTYTEIQRIFNKSCIECHGGLGYPPYYATGTLDFSEDENPPAGDRRMTRSYRNATSLPEMPIGPFPDPPTTSYLYNRITNTGEACPGGMMPCGGPPLSKVDIETIRRWIVGGVPYTEGDPHLKTIDGTNYDFQAAGEFVFLRGEDLTIQTRQTAVSTEGPLGPNQYTGLTSCVSLNTAVAVRLGTHRFTYQPAPNNESGPSSLQLRVDGKPTRIPARGLTLSSGERILQTSAPGGIQIEGLGGTAVIITPAFWDYYRVWYMNVDTRNARSTEGLIGSIASGNWLPALPDGSLLGPRPTSLADRYRDLYGKFANAWRVTDATSLFDYAPGTSTKTFTDESYPGNAPRSCALRRQKAPQKALTLQEATRQCTNIAAGDRKANCVQDVMVTGEVGFAKTYLLTDQIQRKAVPVPPVLVYPDNNKTDLTTSVKFTWKKSPDLNGQPVTYRTCMWIAGQVLTPNDCEAVANGGVSRGIVYAFWVGLAGFLLLALLIWLVKRRVALGYAIAAILAAGIVAYFIGQTRPLSTTVARLEPATAYLWKVIAQDDSGVRVESETRRFTVK